MVSKRTFVVGPMALLLLSGAALHGHAQEAEETGLRRTVGVEDEVVPPSVPAMNRISIGDDEEPVARRRNIVEDAYAQQGVRAGALRLLPSLEIGSVVASNANRQPDKNDGDVALRVKPSLRWESDWSRHQFTGTASMDAEKFLGNDDLQSLNGELLGALRLDIRRTTHADIDAAYTLTSTGVGSSGVPATAKGKRIDQVIKTTAGVTHDLGGIEAGLRLGVSRNLFGDLDLLGGGTEDNSDRDYTELTVAARAALKTGAIVQPFAEVAYVPRLHDKRQDRFGVKRNSQGLLLSVGLALADDPIWTGDVAATFEVRDYEDSSLGTLSSPGIAANLNWRPTDLTRFEFNSGASLSETISAGQAANQTWFAGVTATHALRENIDVFAGLRVSAEKAAGDLATTTTDTVGVNWTLNPMLVWSARYEGTLFNGAAAGSDYSDHRLLTSIILRR